MKPAFVLMPLLLPRLSDRAAAQLLDILDQLLGCIRHHYAPQLQRWRRRQTHLDQPRATPPTLFDGEPF